MANTPDPQPLDLEWLRKGPLGVADAERLVAEVERLRAEVAPRDAVIARWEYASGAIGPTHIEVQWSHDLHRGSGWYLTALGPDQDWHIKIVDQPLGTRADIWSAMAEAVRVVMAAGA